jgi:hypothetical protein
LRAVALAAGISQRVLSDTQVIFITIIAIYIVLAEKIGTPLSKKLPEDEVQKRQIERRAKAYTIIDYQLYKRSTSGVFMKCISQVDGIEILREIHEGECGHHAAARSLVAKAFYHGFY